MAYYTTILGSDLLELLRQSGTGVTAKNNSNTKDWGQFLQVSNGMEVYYRTSDDGKVEVEVRMLQNDENVPPVMKPLNESATYHFVIPSHIFEGRNVYEFAKDFYKGQSDIDFDDTCVERYATGIQRLAIGFEERIRIDSYPGESTTTETWTTSGGGGTSTTPRSDVGQNSIHSINVTLPNLTIVLSLILGCLM